MFIYIFISVADRLPPAPDQPYIYYIFIFIYIFISVADRLPPTPDQPCPL